MCPRRAGGRGIEPQTAEQERQRHPCLAADDDHQYHCQPHHKRDIGAVTQHPDWRDEKCHGRHQRTAAGRLSGTNPGETTCVISRSFPANTKAGADSESGQDKSGPVNWPETRIDKRQRQWQRPGSAKSQKQEKLWLRQWTRLNRTRVNVSEWVVYPPILTQGVIEAGKWADVTLGFAAGVDAQGNERIA